AIAVTFWPVLPSVGVDALLLQRARAAAMVLVLGGASALVGESMNRSIDPAETAAPMETAVGARYSKTIDEVRAVVAPDDCVRAAERWKLEALWLARLGGL